VNGWKADIPEELRAGRKALNYAAIAPPMLIIAVGERAGKSLSQQQ
jgi:hypothetical protein